MDDNVVAAMARWPDVPDVFGWLSLTERGQWRLHPLGDALDAPSSGTGVPANQGEPITSLPILAFINRNYAADGKGQWYFQNGPQRVYVRLDAAPFVIHTTTDRNDNVDHPLSLQTHNGLCIGSASNWWLTDDGRLYAATEHGPGLIAGRDLEFVLNQLATAEGEPLLAFLARQPGLQPDRPIALQGIHPRLALSNPGAVASHLNHCPASSIEQAMGFKRWPRP